MEFIHPEIECGNCKGTVGMNCGCSLSPGREIQEVLAQARLIQLGLAERPDVPQEPFPVCLREDYQIGRKDGLAAGRALVAALLTAFDRAMSSTLLSERDAIRELVRGLREVVGDGLEQA